MRRYITAGLFVTMLPITATFAQKKHPSSPTSSSSKKKHAVKKNANVHFGIASFYANKFNGRRTANGEIFSQKKLTGASNIVPLNSWVRVTNLHNKRTVVVRITDRMHPKNKRLIDLSRLAAVQLGYTGYGLTRVKVEVLGKHYSTKEPEVLTTK